MLVGHREGRQGAAGGRQGHQTRREPRERRRQWEQGIILKGDTEGLGDGWGL